MSILIGCLFIAALLPMLSKIPVAYAMHKQKGYDNNYPRIQQMQLKGFGARAMAAHQNSFEALIVFTAAILAAFATHTSTLFIQLLAIFFIVARVFYHLCYLINWATLRSIFFIIGYVASLVILFCCL